jgi:archaeal flagellar protein FlaJ
MPKIEKKTQKLIAAASVVAAVAIVVVGYLLDGAGAVSDFLVFALICVIGPLAAVDYVNQHWQKGIDQHLPEMFTSIVQAQEVGMTLPQALDDAAKRDHGPLTPELKRLTVQMSWGYSFEDALIAFGKRIGTNLVQRILPLIIEASRSGGKVEHVFEPMGKFIQTNNLMEKERKGQTRPYIIIIYVALFVFLFTIVLLFKTFFAAAGGTALMATDATSPQDMQQLFMHMTIIQSFFGGLAAGKMGEGSMQAGLKHSLVMIVVGYLSLKLFM